MRVGGPRWRLGGAVAAAVCVARRLSSPVDIVTTPLAPSLLLPLCSGGHCVGPCLCRRLPRPLLHRAARAALPAWGAHPAADDAVAQVGAPVAMHVCVCVGRHGRTCPRPHLSRQPHAWHLHAWHSHAWQCQPAVACWRERRAACSPPPLCAAAWWRWLLWTCAAVRSAASHPPMAPAGAWWLQATVGGRMGKEGRCAEGQGRAGRQCGSPTAPADPFLLPASGCDAASTGPT